MSSLYCYLWWIDNIFALDLINKQKGWIELNIKCPTKGVYLAILTSTDDIHLFGYGNGVHYSIASSLLLEDINCENKSSLVKPYYAN